MNRFINFTRDELQVIRRGVYSIFDDADMDSVDEEMSNNLLSEIQEAEEIDTWLSPKTNG